ncbi:allantoate amidohydrolase [Rhodobaculum claviforme]|uniref:Allantoate amidohydrolase n=2 Tax=Rhodobaculum claviforme TaxID=1549854 RepID=A0A934TN68_9RHOB|nr:allantoate amidohydrolase [Rhodobaculum claviforme]
MADAARDSGLEVTTDAAANTYARWAAQGGDGRSVLIGSHLDSVPRGGNFDGAAGVLAGLVALRALRDAGLRPLRDLIAMGIRAEESVWFEVSYIGSRAALGTLPEGTLERAHRIDTGRTLAQHITECGGDPDALRAGPTFAPDRIAAFLEVHIEQAPVLLETGDALGICTGIPGNVRYPAACILGRHQHVGTPRRFRHDTAVAGAVLAVELDRLWQRLEAEGTPAAITLGRFHTDADRHGLTTVPGLFHFSLDMRAQDPVVLARLEAELLALVARIEAEYRVTFQLGARASAAVGPMAADIRDDLAAAAAHHGVSHMMLGSPASHDAAAFGAAGVPVGMVLVRNENGSHTPEEAMEIEDFMAACVVVADWLARRHCQP